MKLLRLFALVALGVSALGAAEPAAPDAAARLAAAQKLVASLKPQQGVVDLKGGLARVNLPPAFRYLSPHDAAVVLHDLWGNPKANDTLGMLVPANFDPLDEKAWVIVLTYQEDGHVKDDDAAHIDYTKLLKEMKEGTLEASKEREKEGYGPIELVGWAAPPRYDAAAHKLYWAKEIKFGGASANTLNYNIRMLGRKGVLVLNAVAEIGQLKEVEAATPAILSMVDFQPGQRYADFNDSTDKVAEYGIAALVAGGIAAKTGLLKGLWLGILAFKKFILLGLFALAGVFKKFFSRGGAKDAGQLRSP